MSALSIRKLPKTLDEALKKKAKQTGHTKTEIVIEILNKEFALDDAQARRETLKEIFSNTSQAELKRLEDALSIFEKIDKDLWK